MMKKKPLTRQKLLQALAILRSGIGLTDEQRDEITCILIGHSCIVSECWGQVTCQRCGGILGELMLGAQVKNDWLVTPHIPSSRDNRDSVTYMSARQFMNRYKKLRWKDKQFVDVSNIRSASDLFDETLHVPGPDLVKTFMGPDEIDA